MLKNERQEQLLRILTKKQTMSVSDLSEALNTSMMTIRRDLNSLEQKGLIKRVHGGVFLQRKDNNQPSFHERLDEFSDAKNKIGKKAAEYIKNGDIVFFDAGTTTLAIVEHIPDDLEFTAITSGLLTAVALSNKPNINVITIGGNVHKSSYSSINYLAVEAIKRFNGNSAFISTKAFNFPEGAFEAQLPLIEVKTTMVEMSETVYLLADHSKFNTKSLCHSVNLSSIDVIITDNLEQPEIEQQIADSGIKLIKT